jgi:hypothetical protein
MGLVSAANPNLCQECEGIKWEKVFSESLEASAVAASPGVHSGSPFLHGIGTKGELPSEMARMMEMEEPSVIDCLEEELAAKKAIAEALAKEIDVMQKVLSTASRRTDKE